MKKPHIVIIGAGSATFSTTIVCDLCLKKELAGSHVTFMDVDAHKLDLIDNLARRLARELHADLTFSKTTSREAALEGADFIINMAQVGGHAYAEACRSLGTEHGYYRGSWLHYLRQIVFFGEVAADIARICPSAWLIQSANPVFEGCMTLGRTSPVKVIGLCHGHYGIRGVLRELGLDPDKGAGRAVGFNHWIWLSELQYEGEDIMPLLDRWIRDHASDDLSNQYDLGKAAIEQYRIYGRLPIGDTARMAAWWMHTDYPMKQKWFGEVGGMDSHVGWHKFLDRLEQKNQEVEQLAANPAGRIDSVFKLAPSSEQVVPIIDSLTNNHQGIYQVNIPNAGQIIKGIPEDVVVECQALIDGFGIHPVSEKPFPKNLMIKAMIPRWAYAELMVEAVRQHDKDLLVYYMLEDHRTRSYEQAANYIDAWLNMPGNDVMKAYFMG